MQFNAVIEASSYLGSCTSNGLYKIIIAEEDTKLMSMWLLSVK